MTMPCLLRQDFDSAAFGRPFFRLTRFDPERLPAELAARAEWSKSTVRNRRARPP